MITTSATTSSPGSSVNVTVTVRDGNGNPVANAPVPLNVTKQPGTGASVTAGSSTTNAAGVLNGTLKIGTGNGVVEVTASPAGFSRRATVASGTSAVESEVALPNTGAGAAGGDPLPLGFVAMMLAGIGVATAGMGLRRTMRGSHR